MSGLLLIALALFQPAAPGVRTVGKGPSSGITTPRQVVIRSSSELTALWRAHNVNAPPPAVDFRREMVVGVFLGERPTAGYSVEIIRTVDANGRLRVEYVETRPPAGSVAAQVLTAPFHLVAIPRHVDPVSFEPVEK